MSNSIVSNMEKRHIHAEVFLKALAMTVAFGIICIMIIGAVYAAMNNHENVAITIASGSGLTLVVGVIAKIIFGRPQDAVKQPQASRQNRKRRQV
jgi:hypothetical protein